jgi:hypothetical protein
VQTVELSIILLKDSTILLSIFLIDSAAKPIYKKKKEQHFMLLFPNQST